MSAATKTTDYRQLMRKVERLVAEIELLDDVDATVHTVAESIITHFRSELGIFGGRLYKRNDDDYVLLATFCGAKELQPGLRLPKTYPPIAECLIHGTIFMGPNDIGVDSNLEADLGVTEFACVEVGSDEYILAFNVESGAQSEDVLFSLQIVRHAVNQKLRQERMQEVFREARRIQASILPDGPPDYPPYDIAGRSDSMESVGGDFYDFIEVTPKILGLAVADVSGHGLPAALQVRDIHMGLRMGLARDFKIVRTVERMNDIIHSSTLTSRFVALFYGELERNGNFIYVNAGHLAPFHLRADGAYRFLEEGGPVLGPLAKTSYERGFVYLRPGDLLVFVTDGIVETLEAGGRVENEYGNDRLIELMRRNRHRTAAELVDDIFTSVDQFSEGAPSGDDRTAVVVKMPELAETPEFIEMPYVASPPPTP
jgi:sigma-B regulation protein RsbU (phosphoserine phosphatase)